MAPLKPRVGRSALSKPVQRKPRPTQRDRAFDDDSDDELFPGDSSVNAVTDNEFVNLQNIADRVGQEVDVFAETLDRFRTQLSEPTTQRHAALQLSTTFRDYALDQVKTLKKQHQVRRLQDGRDSFTKQADNPFLSRAGSVTSSRAVAAEDAGHKTIRQWQAEADTWDLFRIVLKSRYPSEDEVEAHKIRLEELGQPHRYMSNEHLWQCFVLSDNVAKERHLVLKWLEQVASSENDIKQITSEEPSKKHGAVWTNGWMETRERIKGAKRMRMGADAPLDVRRSDGSDLLVSSLDPDAPSRQRKALERADAVSERTLWMACFDMLRQGKPWADICAWCVERNQGWRALSMGIASGEQGAVNGAGGASSALFRRMCLLAARSTSADAYEAAVYGLLAGDVDTVKKACRSWNDHVFVHFNSLLLAQYDRYVLGFRTLHLPLDFIRRNGLTDAVSGQTASLNPKHLISSLASLQSLSKEAHSAIKLVQGSLIADTFQDLCLRVGAAISDEAFKDEPSVVIKRIRKEENEELAEVAIARDPDALRIITHAVIILRHLEASSYDLRDELDNIIAGYIQLLRSVSKADVTPIHGFMMAPERCVASLAQVIADNQDPRDAMEFLKITQIYNIDAIAVITGQYSYQLDRVLNNSSQTPAAFQMLENTKDQLYPTRRVKLDGLDVPLSDDDKALVSGLEIFHLIDGHWTVTFNALATSCRKLLSAGHFATTRAVVEHVQFERLSQSKSVGILGHPVNVMNPEETMVAGTSEEKILELQLMQREAQAYYDVTVLVQAVNALEAWRQVEYDNVHVQPIPPNAPARLKRALEDVMISMEMLFQGILVDAKDDEEAAMHASIRARYLPEIVLGYLTVLSAAGDLISRDALLNAMDISTIVASDERSCLKQAFVDAGRMTELVTMFAEISKVMLKLNERAAPRKKNRKERAGRTLGIWDIYS